MEVGQGGKVSALDEIKKNTVLKEKQLSQWQR